MSIKTLLINRLLHWTDIQYRSAPGFVPLTVLTEVLRLARGLYVTCPEHKISFTTLYFDNEARRNQLSIIISFVLTFSEVKRVVASESPQECRVASDTAE